MKADGTKAVAVYPYNIHFENADGEFTEYDNTLLESTDSEGENEYSAEESDIDIRISKKTNGKKLVRVTKDKYTLSWNYTDINKVTGETSEKTEDEDKTTLENMTGEVIFSDVFTDTDLQYILFGDSLKENLILNSPHAPAEFTAEYKYSSLTPSISEDKRSVYLTDGDGNTVFVITAPFMTDKNGNENNNLYYELGEVKENSFILTLKADKNWLSSPDRAYPVTVDPIILTEQTWDQSNYQSAYISSAMPDACFGKNSVTGNYEGSLYVGYENGREKVRSLIQFSLPALNAGDRVVGATMLTYLNACSLETTINIHKVTSEWAQNTVTWNTQPAIDQIVSEYETIPYTLPQNADFVEWDVTTLVNEWYLGTSPNYGIMMKSPAENSGSSHRARFYSSGYTSASAARPLLVIAIRNMSGLEDYYSYSSFSAGTAGTAYVNDFTGNLVFMHNTVNTTGVLMPVSVSEVFNTTGAGLYPDTYPNVGRGKKLNVQQTLRPSSYYGLTGESLEMFPYAYEDGDGTVHYFYKETKDGATRYIDEDGLNLELSITDTSYKITDKSGNVLTFNKTTGLITSTENADGISASFDYIPGTITTGLNAGEEKQFLKTITDGAGHKIELTYELTKGNLVSVKGPDDKITTYSYTNELNTGITYPDGTSSTYNYYSDGVLMWAQSADGYKLSFTYINSDGTKRVREVNESASGTTGQLVRFGFNSPYQTTIRNSGNDRVYGNSDDIRAVYQFDTYGRVSSVKTGLGNGETVAMGSYDFTMGSYADGTDIGKRNRLLTGSAIGKTVNNLLTNHSFESTNNWTASHWLNDVYADNSTASFDTTEKYIGSRSLKITVNTATVKGGYSMYQHAINRVTGGETYTASVYVKTVDITKMSTATVGGAGLGIRVVNASGGVSRLYSDLITGTTNTAIDNGWQRIEYTFTLPEGVTGLRITPMVYSATGTAYFDCVQLEKGEAANKYNILENSDFDYSASGWTVADSESTDTASTAEFNSGAKSFKLSGNTAKAKKLYQTVNVSGSEGDTYIISGFAKANAVPFSKEDNLKLFALSVKICYNEGGEIIKYPAYFNYAVSDWQNVSGVFTLSDDNSETNKTPKSITVYCSYENQPNTCYFDDICLIKEPVPTYSYDEDGNLVSAVETAEKSSSMSYDVNDNLSGVTDEKNVNYSYTYGNTQNPHQLTSATDNKTGIRNDYEYFANGTIKAVNAVSSSGLEKIRTSVAYTTSEDSIADGAYVYRYVDQHGRNTYYDYDQQSGLLNSVKDPNGVYTYYTYNGDNGLVTSTSSAGSTVNYTYDSTYTRLNSVNHNGFNYNFTYDGFGNTVQTKVGNTPLMTNSYAAANGLLQMNVYGNGDIVSYTYDNTGRVTDIAKDGSTAYTWTYSGSGVPNSYTDNVSGKKYLYTYDSLGRLIYQSGKNISDNNNQSSSVYKYDISNNLTQITNTAGTLGVSAWYHYDDINRPTQSYFNTSVEHNYTYDTLGRLGSTELKFSSKTVDKNYTYYNSAGRNSSANNFYYRTTQLQTETIGDRGYTYTYDKVGNITAITEKTTASGSYNEKVSYTYDSLGQLTRENNKDLNKTLVYSYDNGGNITSVKEYAYTTGTVEGTATDTINYTYDSTWKDKLVSYDGQSITYDSIGNPLQYRDGMTFTWFGRQMQTANVGNTAISYEYNADGLRTSKTVGNAVHTYEYTGSTLYYENRDGIQLHYRYDVNGNLASITRINTAGTKYTLYAVCNSRGDVEELRKLSGSLYARYIYDTWGNTIHIYDANGAEITSTANLAVQNPIRYRGYYFDSETGFYYLQSRYYDPVTCRFINADTQLNQKDGIVGFNMFTYCQNNPIIYSDPTGHSIVLTCIIIGAVIGAVAGGAAGAYISKKQTGKVNGWAVAAGVVGGGVVGGLIGWGVGAAITAVGAVATGSAATAAAPVVQQVAEKASTALQTYYPPNDGFSGAVQKITLEAGTLIQRTGDLVGRYIAPAGTPTQMLSLPYDKIGQPTTILQVQQSVDVLAGRVAPWFGQIGGGIQYQLGTPLDQLISEGIIKIFGG